MERTVGSDHGQPPPTEKGSGSQLPLPLSMQFPPPHRGGELILMSTSPTPPPPIACVGDQGPGKIADAALEPTNVLWVTHRSSDGLRVVGASTEEIPADGERGGSSRCHRKFPLTSANKDDTRDFPGPRCLN